MSQAGTQQRSVRVTLLAGVLAACCTASHAQTFYQWTDDRGVVHFATEPPPNGRAEERHLPVPRASAPAPAEQEQPVTDLAEVAAPEAPGGPANVVLSSQQTMRSGPRGVRVSGEVTNTGGENATAVGITVSATDVTQGTPCFSQDIAVSPDTLAPGETGTFDAALQSPCFAGDTPVQLAPVWK